MDRNESAIILAAAASAAFQVLWSSSLGSILSPVEATVAVISSFLAGLGIGGLVIHRLPKQNPVDLLSMAQIGTMIGGIAMYALDGYPLIPLLLIHEALIGISLLLILGTFAKLKSEALLASAISALLTGFVFLPYLGPNSPLLVAMFSGAVFMLLESAPAKSSYRATVPSPEVFSRGFILGAFWCAWAVILLFQLKIAPDAIALIAAIFALGTMRRIELGFDFPSKLGLALISGGAALIIGLYPYASFTFALVLVGLLLVAVFSAQRFEGSIDFFGAASLGALGFYFSVVYLGVFVSLALAIILALATVVILSEYTPGSIPLLMVSLVLGGTLLVQPLELTPKEGVSDITRDFAVHIPKILGHADEIAVFDEVSFMFEGGSYDTVVLHLSGLPRGRFYNHMQMRIRPGGMLVQTFPLTADSGDFKGLLRKTGGAYPHTSMWLVDGNAILVSSRTPLSIDYPRLWRIVGEDMELRDDLRELFYATKFTNMTLVDALTFLYFASPEELSLYASDRGDDMDALSSIFEFKRRLSNTPQAQSFPPLENTYFRTAESVVIPFFGLSAHLDEGWEEVSSGTIVYYHLIENTSQYGISYEKSTAFVKEGVTLGFKAYPSRVMMTLGDSPYTAGLLDEEMLDLAMREITLRGYEATGVSEVIVGEEIRPVVFGGLRDHEAKALAMVWYCDANEAIHVVTLDYLVEDESIDQLLRGVKCTGQGIAPAPSS